TVTTTPREERSTTPPATPTTPGFRLSLLSADKQTQVADALTLNRGGQGKRRVAAARFGGFAGAIPLTMEGLPEGVKATNTTIAAKQNQVDVTLAAEKTAPLGPVHLTVRSGMETALVRGGANQADADNVLLTVALPTPFKIVGDFDMRWAS